MSERRKYTLQLLQDQSGRTASVHVTQRGKAVTPPPPEPPKPEEKIVFDAGPNPITITWQDKDGNGGAYHRIYHIAEVTIHSHKEVDGVRTLLPVSCTISPSDAPTYILEDEEIGSDGTYTIKVTRRNEDSSAKHKPSGSLVITQEETGETLTIPITAREWEESY